MKKNLLSWNAASTVILLFIVLIALSGYKSFISSYYTDLKDAGGVGDAIAGITAPIINIAAAVLVYMSFRQQIKANLLVVNMSKNEHINNYITAKLEQIENKLVDMTSNNTAGWIKKYRELLTKLGKGTDYHENPDDYDDAEKYVLKMSMDSALDYIKEDVSFFRFAARLRIYIKQQMDDETGVHNNMLRVFMDDYIYIMSPFTSISGLFDFAELVEIEDNKLFNHHFRRLRNEYSAAADVDHADTISRP